MAPKKRNFGSIRKLPSGRFQARYTAPDGSEMTAPKTFDTRREAEGWLATEQADLIRGTWRSPSAGSQTLSSYLQAWIEHHPSLRPRTRELYLGLSNRFIVANEKYVGPREQCLGDLPLVQITPALVRQWYAWVSEVSRVGAIAKQSPPQQGSQQWNRALRAWAVREGLTVKATGRIPDAVWEHWERSGQPELIHPHRDRSRAGKAQAAQAYRLLRAVLRTAVDDGHLTANPCQLKGVGGSKAPERKPATPAEVQAIVQASPDRYRVAVLIGAWGGLRAGEAFALTRGSVDLDAGSVTVRVGVSYVNGDGFHFGPPKTDRGYREVHLPMNVMEAIARHMDEFTGPEPDALLFTTRTGRPVASSSRTAWFRRAADGIGREDLRFHDLRHTGATHAARTGATIADLQRRFGHSTVGAAMRYQHSSETADLQIATRLEPMASVS